MRVPSVRPAILPCMPSLQALRLFHQRRIALPVPEDALVLDVGSGDKPSWRADVLLDRYTGAEHSAQRSGRAAARVSKPLFDADAADMPFRDGAFDYAICSNVLEHVADPVGVATELSRVALAGYIEVPEAASAKIVDFPSHVWWCRLVSEPDGPTLVMTAKGAPYFDAEIDAYIEKAGIRHELDSLLNRHFEHRVIQHHWSGSVRLRTEGELDPAFFDAAMRTPGHQRGWEATAAQALTAGLTWRSRHRRRTLEIPFNSVVKPEYQGPDEVLERRIYRVGESSGRVQ